MTGCFSNVTVVSWVFMVSSFTQDRRAWEWVLIRVSRATKRFSRGPRLFPDCGARAAFFADAEGAA